MTGYRKSLLAFLAFVILFEGFVIAVGDVRRPHWGDEWHFQNTIKRFGKEISLDTIKHYEEMSTPLPFIVYALWGRAFGFELHDLRWLSVIIAIITYLIFHRLLFLLLNSRRAVFWGAVFLAAHPYMIGFSIFVYTDMMAVLFLILCCLAHTGRRPVLFGLSMAMAILSRQYMAFLTIAAGLYYLLEYVQSKKAFPLKMLISCLASTVPYWLLVALWGGISPDNSLRAVYLGDELRFQPIILTLYVCLLFAYHFPLLIFFLKDFYSDYKMILASLVCSVFYLIFPVGPTKPSIDVGIPTVGLFHRFLKITLREEILVQVAFYMLFLLALPVLFYVLRDCYVRWRQRRLDIRLLLDLSIISFLAVMPFSYLGWEKYFMPVVPLMILRTLLIGSGRAAGKNSEELVAPIRPPRR